MSSIERKYCLSSTSCLTGLSDIFTLLHICQNCVCFGVFSPMRTICDPYHKELELAFNLGISDIFQAFELSFRCRLYVLLTRGKRRSLNMLTIFSVGHLKTFAE